MARRNKEKEKKTTVAAGETVRQSRPFSLGRFLSVLCCCCFHWLPCETENKLTVRVAGRSRARRSCPFFLSIFPRISARSESTRSTPGNVGGPAVSGSGRSLDGGRDYCVRLYVFLSRLRPSLFLRSFFLSPSFSRGLHHLLFPSLYPSLHSLSLVSISFVLVLVSRPRRPEQSGVYSLQSVPHLAIGSSPSFLIDRRNYAQLKEKQYEVANHSCSDS